MKMKKVLFRAPVLTFSGYGVHARQVCRVLIEKAERKEIDLYIELTRWGNTPWALRDDIFDGQVKMIRKYFRPTHDAEGNRMKFDVSVQLLLPNEWTKEPGAVNIGMSAVVESDRANPLWVTACNEMDHVIVPSKHAERALRNALADADVITTPIHVIPESYIEALDRDVPSVDFGFETNFNFLVVGQLTSNNSATDRKNTFGAIRTICEAFKNDPDVGIVLKTNSGRGTKIDRKVTVDKFRQVLAAVRTGDNPKLYVVHGDMQDDEMAALYRDPSIKALVALTKGEGFGLPILEAAVAGMPVIATDWSGHLDFMNKGRFIKIGCELQPIPVQKVDRHKDNEAGRNIWIEGSRWAIPRDSNVDKALKKFRQSPDIPTQWAADLSKTLRQEYSYAAVKDMYEALMRPILGE